MGTSIIIVFLAANSLDKIVERPSRHIRNLNNPGVLSSIPGQGAEEHGFEDAILVRQQPAVAWNPPDFGFDAREERDVTRALCVQERIGVASHGTVGGEDKGSQ